MKKLAVSIFHPFVKFNNKYTFKENHGVFIEEISKYYSDVYILTRTLSKNRIPSWMFSGGKIMYNYEFTNPKIKYIKSNFINIFYPLYYLFTLFIVDEVIFFMPSKSFLLYSPILKLIRKPYYVYVASDIEAYLKESFFYKIYKYINYKFLTYSSGVMCRGNNNFNKINNKNKILINSLIIISGNVYTKTSKNKTIIYVGTIDKNKNVDKIIESFKIINKFDPEFVLYIIGPNTIENEKYLNELKENSRELVKKGKIIFVGPVYDKDVLSSYYSKAEFLINVSNYEGFPKVIHECMSFNVIPVLRESKNYGNILIKYKNYLPVDSSNIISSISDNILNTPSSLKDEIIKNNKQIINEIEKNKPSNQFLKLANKL